MPPLRRAATTSVGSDGTLASLNEAAAAQNGFYITDDLLGAYPFATALGGTGGAGLTYGTPGGVPTIPAGWTAALLQGHPGLAIVNTSALNDSGGINCSFNGNMYTQNAGSPPLYWTGIFSTPNVLSSAEAVIYAIGPALMIAGSGPYHGWYLQYANGVAGGCWQLYEAQAGSTNLIGASGAVPLVAASWVKASITVKGVNVTAVVNGTQVASVTSTILNASPNNGMAMTPCGAWIKRTAFTSGIVSAFVDRYSLSMVAAGR